MLYVCPLGLWIEIYQIRISTKFCYAFFTSSTILQKRVSQMHWMAYIYHDTYSETLLKYFQKMQGKYLHTATSFIFCKPTKKNTLYFKHKCTDYYIPWCTTITIAYTKLLACNAKCLKICSPLLFRNLS